MGGPVERVRLTADDNVICRSVKARFGNGHDRELFQGMLRRGATTDIDLPGESRNVRNLLFRCRPERGRDATIRVAAEIGRYRETWQRNPDFGRLWARMFNWGSSAVNDWQLIGTETFFGRGDTETTSAGWRGRQIDAVALKPIGSDARCGRIIAHFANGADRPLNANDGEVMRENQIYKLDLPGDRRNLDSLTLRCRPIRQNRVTLQIFSSK